MNRPARVAEKVCRRVIIQRRRSRVAAPARRRGRAGVGDERAWCARGDARERDSRRRGRETPEGVGHAAARRVGVCGNDEGGRRADEGERRK